PVHRAIPWADQATTHGRLPARQRYASSSLAYPWFLTPMICLTHKITDRLVLSDAVFGCEDFVSPFAREVVPNHFQFEPEVEFPHMPSKVVSNSWGSVHFRGDSQPRHHLALRNTQVAQSIAHLAHTAGQGSVS